MTLRARIAAVASLAVTLAVVVVAVSLYLAVRSDLRGQIDRSLTQRSQFFSSAVAALPGTPNLRFRVRGPPQGTPAPSDFPVVIQPARFGGANGYVQFVSGAGGLVVPGGQGSSPTVPLSANDRKIAADGHGRSLSDRTVKGTHLRVLTLGTTTTGKTGDTRGAVMIARPLGEVDHELNSLLLILLGVGLGGIAIAALLGALVARTALRPVVRFTQRTESLAGAMDLSQRLEVSGRDELARLAASFNTTLDALRGRCRRNAS